MFSVSVFVERHLRSMPPSLDGSSAGFDSSLHFASLGGKSVARLGIWYLNLLSVDEKL
jgi:hypothetical protein